MRPFRVIVTAGGTREPIDDVRELANTSTGRFGAAIARAFAWRGVDVTLVGAVGMDATALPPGVRRLEFRSTDDLDAALDLALSVPADAVLMAAAVSDYRSDRTTGKVRSDAESWSIALSRTPKILPTLRDRCPGALLVGFKLLSGARPEDLVATARRQVRDARLDFTVGNDVAELGGGRHPIWLVDAVGERRLDGPRDEVAEALADAVLARLPAPPPPDGPWTEVPGPVHGRARTWWRVPDGLAAGRAFPDVATALAARRAYPHHPVVVPLQAGGVAVGLAPLDAARYAAAWAATPALSDADQSLWWRGAPVARAWRDGDTLHLRPTGLGDDERWPQVLLPGLDVRRVTVPDDRVETFRLAGFQPDGDGRLVVPWRRADVVPAASACLVDVAAGKVLVGRRLVAASNGRLAFPGGKAEPGEDAEQTARRELAEEAGLRAPAGPPWFVRTVWRGDQPGFSIACHVWRVTGTEAPLLTEELDASWRDLRAVADDPDALPGVHLVLDDLVDLLDAV